VAAKVHAVHIVITARIAVTISVCSGYFSERPTGSRRSVANGLCHRGARKRKAPGGSGRYAWVVPAWPPISPELIVAAYLQGIFPMADERGKIGWYSPDPRAIFPLEDFHIPRSLRKTLKKNPFEVKFDTAFRDVMMGCADREPTWINEKILDNYTKLHERGLCHSVEAWQGGELVGGLYGVAL
jgi:hypothetical protein